MKICPKCKISYFNTVNYCVNDGTKLSACTPCRKCGKEITEESYLFCPNCGEPTKENDK